MKKFLTGLLACVLLVQILTTVALAYEVPVPSSDWNATMPLPNRQLTESELNDWTYEWCQNEVTQFELDVLNLTNEYRAEYDLPPLTLNLDLSRAARFKSQSMNNLGYFAHENPHYGGFSVIVELFHDWTSSIGENIAFGHLTANEVVASWIDSTGHRANILNPAFTSMGSGRFGTHTTQIFSGTNTSGRTCAALELIPPGDNDNGGEILPTYDLTVIGGTGSGAFAAGAVVPISAIVPTGYRFVSWNISVGVTIINFTAANTTIIMPAGGASVEAVFAEGVEDPIQILFDFLATNTAENPIITNLSANATPTMVQTAIANYLQALAGVYGNAEVTVAASSIGLNSMQATVTIDAGVTTALQILTIYFTRATNDGSGGTGSPSGPVVSGPGGSGSGSISSGGTGTSGGTSTTTSNNTSSSSSSTLPQTSIASVNPPLIGLVITGFGILLAKKKQTSLI